jgi:hypothetical protein
MVGILNKTRRATLVGATAFVGLFAKASARAATPDVVPAGKPQSIDSVSLASSIGASMVGYLASGANAVKRSLLDRGRDTISAFDYMTPEQITSVRNGAPTDVTAALQNAINSITTYAGTIELPPGNFRLSAPLVTTKPGLVLRGASRYGTYLTAPGGATFDMLRIAHQQVEVTGIIFRPATAEQLPIRIYAGRAHIHDNYLLAAANNAGIGILLTDRNPTTGATVPGAYAHTIDNNTIGDSGHAFAYGITESSTIGITATRFRENNIISNHPIQIKKGGGNVYRDNLLQCAGSAPSGVGIMLGAGTTGEKISGNYFEGFKAMIETLNTSNNHQIFHAVGNHNDNCAVAVADAGAKNYVIEDAVQKCETRNGWSTVYPGASWRLQTAAGKTAFAADSAGNCFLGASSGASHVINRAESTEGTIILSFQASGGPVCTMQDARGRGANNANAVLWMNKSSTTGRSINAAGTVNTSGADYAEYMRKADTCGPVAKGQIVGIDEDGNITDRWALALTFATKSTNPSYVGGDVWHTDPRPTPPTIPSENAEQAMLSSYADEYVRYEQGLAAWDTAHEAARCKMDRIAFAGQIPMNIWGAQPGQYIVPVQDGDGIGGVAMNEVDMTLSEYMRAVGKVVAIENDGRARVIVKVV